MHVLVSALGRFTSPTGVCRHAANIVKALAMRVEVRKITLLVGEWQREYYSRWVSGEGKVELCSVSIKNSSLNRNLWYAFSLPKMAEAAGADIVHLAFPVPVLRGRFKMPVVATVHDLYPYEMPQHFGFPNYIFNRQFLKMCVAGSDGTICVSTTTLHSLTLCLGRLVRHRDVTVIYNCVEQPEENDSRPSRVLSQTGSGPFLLAIAQHRKNKNLDLLIRAFERLRRHESMSGLRLLIVGSDGPETASLHALVAELSIDQEVIFDSGLSEQELWWAYDNALATVVTSQQEGFCLPLVEALQRGRRVICSDIPVLREVAGDAAAYFPLAGGEASLAEAILSALQSPPLAPLTRLDRYSFEASGLAYLAVYCRLLEARSRRSRSISLPLPRRTQLSRRPVRNSSLAAEAENEQPAKKLRVLMLHNRYLWPGGEDTAMRADIRLLEHFGNTVELMEFRNEHITTFAEKIKTAVNSAYSRRIRSAVETRIEQFKPDFIHVHNPFPGLTPAVYFAANSLGVPVVQTLHNFRLMCPAATCFRDNAVCELCVGKKFPLPGVLHGCYRHSRSGTFILGSMTAIHQMLGTWQQRVQSFIAVSEFLRRKFWDSGLSLAPIEVKPNCVFDSGIGSGSGGYVLFVGRLDKGKGLEHLLQAWPRVQGARHLAIVGDGPLRDLVKTAAAANSTIRWMGWKSGEEVRRLMKEATLLVFPSESYETFGMPILEAFAAGTPVVASAIGALPELVTHGETGMLVPPASPEALAEAVQGLLVSGKAEQMRPAARRRYESHYSIEQNYAQLCAIYARAASRAAARPPLDRLPQAA